VGIMGFVPRELMTIPPHRFKRITTIYITLNPKAIEKPGVLSKILEQTTSRDINVLGMFTSANPIEEYACITLFIDSTKIEESKLNELVSKIREALKELEGEVKTYTSPVEGVAIDPYSFPIIAMGSRAIILMKHSLRGIIEGFIRIGAEILLNMIGREMGRASFKDHERIAGKNLEKLIKMIEARLMMSGFGIIKVENIDMEAYEFKVNIEYCIECEILEELKRPSGSQLVKGMLEGWFTELTGMDMVAYEERCISRGDPYCQFKLKPRYSSE